MADLSSDAQAFCWAWAPFPSQRLSNQRKRLANSPHIVVPANSFHCQPPTPSTDDTDNTGALALPTHR
jgi:hypothetical protein